MVDCCNVLQVDSPMNLRNPHDLVILMRQETTVNYLKELEVKHNAKYWLIAETTDEVFSQGF